MNRLWQYQSKAEPVLEQITLDKWYQRPSEPTRVSRFVSSVFAASLFFVSLVTPTEAITVDKWHPQAADVVKSELSLKYITETSFIDIQEELITLDEWFREITQPVRKRKHLKDITIFTTDANSLIEPITLDKWFQQHHIVRAPVTVTGNLISSQFYLDITAIAPETITLDKWYRETAIPVWFIPRLTYLKPYIEYDTQALTASENITVDKWYRPTEQPLFDVKRQQWLYPNFEKHTVTPVVVEVITVDKWYQPASEPVRVAPRTNDYFRYLIQDPSLEGILTHLPLKSLVLKIDKDLGMTLGLTGNTLPISVVTTVPSVAPPGGKGVVFYVAGGSLTVYVWDPATNSWIS